MHLIEMTRKRTRENLIQALGEPCPDCEGRGFIQSSKTICHKLFRELPKVAQYLKDETLVVRAHPTVALRLENEEAEPLHAVEQSISRKVLVRSEPSFHRERFEIVPGP